MSDRGRKRKRAGLPRRRRRRRRQPQPDSAEDSSHPNVSASTRTRPRSLTSWIIQTRAHLTQERESVLSRLSESRSLTVRLVSIQPGLLGLSVLVFSGSLATLALIKTGTPVVFPSSESGASASQRRAPRGVVRKILGPRMFEVLADKLAKGSASSTGGGSSDSSSASASWGDVFADENNVRMNLAEDDVTMDRYFQCLNILEAYVRGTTSSRALPCERVLEVAFRQRGPEFEEAFALEEFRWHDKMLNDSQKEAVRFALSSKDICCILGPPGTGKTVSVVEILKQAVVEMSMTVLVAAPSNVAVDNILMRLGTAGRRMGVCRVGHQARINEMLAEYSLDHLVNHMMSDEAKDLKKEQALLMKRIVKTKRKGEKRRLWRDYRNLSRQLKKAEREACASIVKTSQCIVATLTGCSRRLLQNRVFDLVVIDESAQALEIASWMAIKTGKRAILVGDFHQLGPTIIDTTIEKKLGLSLMERLCEVHGEDSISRMLTTQYRMNSEIMEWSSNAYYGGRLVADDSVAEHLLTDLDGVEECGEDSDDEIDEISCDPVATAIFMIDTSTSSFQEEVSETGSKWNAGEVDLVSKHVALLLRAGVQENHIGIITFYSAQVAQLKARFAEENPFIEISTVDGFQGREKECIVISFVRSNDECEVGFLDNYRRVNVAVTRAKRHVCLVGNARLLCRNPMLKSLIDYFNENAEVRMAEEF